VGKLGNVRDEGGSDLADEGVSSRLLCRGEGWPDARALAADHLTRDVAEQLVVALGSVRANLAEGYSRSPGRDRARFFEYALGSARECREWYRHARHVLGEACVSARCGVLDEIARMLLAIIPRERDRKIERAAQ
jgi:four helix bundle protein